MMPDNKVCFDAPRLRVENLSYSYVSGKKAVENIFLDISGGEVFGLLGANGAGKTTTMKLVSGILGLQEGTVMSCGIGLGDDPVGYKKLIAYVPDEPVFYDNMSVGGHLDFICNIFSIGIEERKRNIAMLSGKLGLSDLMGKRISVLSRGMRQKLSLLTALVHDPELLILDEPLTALDPLSSNQVKALIRSFADSGGAVLLSTHMLEAAEQLCSRIGIISSGRLLDVASADELAERGSLKEYFLSVAYDGV